MRLSRARAIAPHRNRVEADQFANDYQFGPIGEGPEGDHFREGTGVVVGVAAADPDRRVDADQGAHAVPLDFECPLRPRRQDRWARDEHRCYHRTNTAIASADLATDRMGNVPSRPGSGRSNAPGRPVRVDRYLYPLGTK